MMSETPKQEMKPWDKTKQKKRKCIFYQEVKSLKEGEAKIFQCECNRHKGEDISVVVFDKVVREVR